MTTMAIAEDASTDRTTLKTRSLRICGDQLLSVNPRELFYGHEFMRNSLTVTKSKLGSDCSGRHDSPRC